MKKENIIKALTTGLLAGYGGKTKFSKVIRGSFELTVSHYQKDDTVYHDEWTNNGGQEIVRVGNEMFTRVYAGGMVDQKILTRLDITPQEIISYLISKINEITDKTRLFSDYISNSKDSWSYEYKIINKDEQLSITTGKETISYRSIIVFSHVFVLSPLTQ